MMEKIYASKTSSKTNNTTHCQPPPPAPAPVPVPAAAPGAGSDTVVQLQQLSQLHDSGVLTDDEFAAAKQKVLAGE